MPTPVPMPAPNGKSVVASAALAPPGLSLPPAVQYMEPLRLGPAGPDGRVDVYGGRAEVTGDLSPDEVTLVLESRRDKLEACYRDARTVDAHAAGGVTFEIRIGVRGEITELRRSATDPGLSKVHACMTTALEGSTFPAPRGGTVKVTYRLLLTPPGSTLIGGPPG
jgi:hypothetical protein